MAAHSEGRLIILVHKNYMLYARLKVNLAIVIVTLFSCEVDDRFKSFDQVSAGHFCQD